MGTNNDVPVKGFRTSYGDKAAAHLVGTAALSPPGSYLMYVGWLVYKDDTGLTIWRSGDQPEVVGLIARVHREGNPGEGPDEIQCDILPLDEEGQRQFNLERKSDD